MEPIHRRHNDVGHRDSHLHIVYQGLHGTGKSPHIEQVAARLNWPCVRVNLDGHISRLDLITDRRLLESMVSVADNRLV